MENKNNTDHKNSAPEDGAAYFKENPTAPVRILVSTATHLVPGDGFFARTEFIGNLISQHYWNQDFEWGRDRFQAYNAEFGYNNRTCYFLIDHGKTSNDDVVPIRWYRWTGESLVPIYEALPSKIRRRLKKISFTPMPRKEPHQISATERRQSIQARLRRDMGLAGGDFEFLREGPEHAIWLESNIEARFWSKYKSLEAEWQDFEQKLACGLIRRVRRGKKEELNDCTGAWDCECTLCSS